MIVTFNNKSSFTAQIWQVLGLTDEIRMMRITPGNKVEAEMDERNAWTQFSKIIWRDAYDSEENQVQIVEAVPRKDFKKSSLQEPVLECDLSWDFKENSGNTPCFTHSYVISPDLNLRINMHLNIHIWVEVPKENFVAPYRRLELGNSISPFSADDIVSDDRIKNDFFLRLAERRSDSEMKKIGLIKQVEKKVFAE